MIVSERGNLTGGIFLSISRMSTVKIRARSLFHTPASRIGAGKAGLSHQGMVTWGSRAQCAVMCGDQWTARPPTICLFSLATDH